VKRDVIAEARGAALLDRFAPRLALGDRATALARLQTLALAHPSLPLPALAGHAVVALSGLISDAGVFAAPGALGTPPARLAPERALELAVSRAASAPPELGDGSPIQWAHEETSIEGPLGLWRARRERGPAAGERLFVYVHVPFCRTRCAFCQFESVVDGRADARVAYVRSLVEEAAALHAELGTQLADAITLGGGTPSELAAPLLGEVLVALRGLVAPRPGAYVSVELNPDSCTADRLALLVEAGVTGVWMGVQSFHAPTLHAVARGYQTSTMVHDAVALVRAQPGLALGLDLLAPLPQESLESFSAGVSEALALTPDELVLYRYQPVLRGADRTIAPGELPYELALATFEARANDAGYALVQHTGSSCVARRPGAVVPEVRYVQHPREPTSLLGLGPHAESHVFGHGRYVALGSSSGNHRYRVERTDLPLERALLVARRFTAALPVDETVLAEATGASLTQTRGEAVGYFTARGELEPDASGSLLAPRWRTREEALRASWAFLDPRSLRGLGPHDEAERSSLLTALDRAGLGSDAGSSASELDTRLAALGVRAWLSAAGLRRGALTGKLALEDLLLEESDDGLQALFSRAALPAAAVVARLIVEGVLDDAPALESAADRATLTLSVRARAPQALAWLLATLDVSCTTHGGVETLSAIRLALGTTRAQVELVRVLGPTSPSGRALARVLGAGGDELLAASRTEHVVVASSGAQALELRAHAPAARALLRKCLEARSASLVKELEGCARTLGAELDGLRLPLEVTSQGPRPRLDALEATLVRASRTRRRLPAAG